MVAFLRYIVDCTLYTALAAQSAHDHVVWLVLSYAVGSVYMHVTYSCMYTLPLRLTAAVTVVPVAHS